MVFPPIYQYPVLVGLIAFDETNEPYLFHF